MCLAARKQLRATQLLAPPRLRLEAKTLGLHAAMRRQVAQGQPPARGERIGGRAPHRVKPDIALSQVIEWEDEIREMPPFLPGSSPNRVVRLLMRGAVKDANRRLKRGARSVCSRTAAVTKATSRRAALTRRQRRARRTESCGEFLGTAWPTQEVALSFQTMLRPQDP